MRYLSCAYLRVYQPLEAFGDADAEAMRRQIDHPSRPDGRFALGLIAPSEAQVVYATEVDGQTYYCPGQTELRTLLGLVAFERALPQEAKASFFSSDQVAAAQSELETLRRRQPDLRPCVVQSAWHIPIRWFACFSDDERRIEQFGDHPSIRYRTRVGRAVERVTEALSRLGGGAVHPVIVGMIKELQDWLSTFHPDGILELDYASVAGLFSPDDLADDHSAADVWNAIDALAEGDGMRAGLHYRRVDERWSRVRQRESLN